MNSIYEQIKTFKNKYGFTMSFRLKAHTRVIEKHLNPGERVTYIFAAQLNESPVDIIHTCVVALTNRRLLVAQKKLLWGYNLYSITPDLFNDLTVRMGLIWAKITIDTVKEVVYLSNIDKKAAVEIETKITDFMIREKRRYGIRPPASP